VQVLAPLPDFAMTWVDTAPERFPEEVPPRRHRADRHPDPGAVVAEAPSRPST
jgi:xanthine dehydrogenase accessory factor